MFKRIKEIETKEDFVEFIYKLSQDYQENSASWENKDVNTFLKAFAAWVEDMDGYYINQGQPIPNNINWKVLADMFMGAKIYE